MTEIGHRYSLYSLFHSEFEVSRRELGQQVNSPYAQDSARILEERVPVKVGQIVIPKIQRDYAQGRESALDIRAGFLSSLKAALVDKEGKNKCSLNFIYGTFSEMQGKRGAVSFIPFDGQQRLTTLYLLYWYASRKDEIGSDYSDWLKGFRYDTRFSATVFTTMFLPSVKSLRLSDDEAAWLRSIDVEGDTDDVVPVERGVFSRWLKNKSSFSTSWEDDPTIAGMLVMLDAIHEKFHDVENLWERLCVTDKNLLPVYFFFKHISRTSDAGDVFIKMNSRGKLLTEYECFKADLFRMLRERGCGDCRCDEITKKIDGTWEQAFWKSSKRSKDEDVDTCLMRYLNFAIDILGIEKGKLKDLNPQPERYVAERMKRILLNDSGSIDELCLNRFLDAVDTWCVKAGDDVCCEADGYFQKHFTAEKDESRIRVFFKPDPDEIFGTILRTGHLELNAMALVHAVLAARKQNLSDGQFDSRMRSVRNLVYSMDKGVNELPYILQKTRQIMEKGLSDGREIKDAVPDKQLKELLFKNEGSTKQFTDAQLDEEFLKDWLREASPKIYADIRELEEEDWFKGQIGVLLAKVLCASDTAEKLRVLEEWYTPCARLFRRIFLKGDLSDSCLRKALFFSKKNGFRYWVTSNARFWMGASTGDFGWKSAKPYFARAGAPQEALQALLSDSWFSSAEGEGQDLLRRFADRKLPDFADASDKFDLLWYMANYYDDIFALWRKNDAGRDYKCYGRILSFGDDCVLQMLDSKTRSRDYWDPFLWVAVNRVDPASTSQTTGGAFINLVHKSNVDDRCGVVHYTSGTKVWFNSDGIVIHTSSEEIRNAVRSLENTEDREDGNLLVRTRQDGDKKDSRDRISVCGIVLSTLLKCGMASKLVVPSVEIGSSMDAP